MLRAPLIAILTSLMLIGCGNANNKTPDANSAPTSSPSSSNVSDIQSTLSANLKASGIEATIESVAPTEMPNIYLVTLSDMPPIFTDNTGKYIIQGDVIKVGEGTPINISGNALKDVAKTALGAVDKSEMIIFPAKGDTKAAIYVFTDPACGYCQMLHKDINAINEAGIEVRYLAWPRGDQFIPLSTAVWCAKDKSAALTAAKAGIAPEPATCDNPIAKHMALGFKLGVSGTPAIFTESGEQIGGYLPPAELIAAATTKK